MFVFFALLRGIVFFKNLVRHEPLVSLDSWRGVLRCQHHLQDDRVTDAWQREAPGSLKGTLREPREMEDVPR